MAVTAFKQGHRAHVLIPLVLLCACVVHRALHLYFLWPELAQHLEGADNVMQLIPAQVWRDHFMSAWWYLQQSPPLPNLLFGALVVLIEGEQHITLAILLVQIALAGAGVALFSSLLLRLQMPLWVAFVFPFILYFGADLFVMEYNARGHFYYEQIALVLCLAASHAALSYLRSPGAAAALMLGLIVALLALTRSTFSYFAIPVALWLLISGPWRFKDLAIYLLPILLLQGGWALKNYSVHGYWSIASSSWGGANARTGDIRRDGGKDVTRWLLEWERENKILCEPAYWRMAKQYKQPVFLFPRKDWVLSFPQPEEVLQRNQRAIDARERLVYFDTATFREFSHCLEKIYVSYWLHHPQATLGDVWTSYKLFWLPIREFAVRNPNPIAPPDYKQADEPTPWAWLQQGGAELGSSGFRIAYFDMEKWPIPFSYDAVSLMLLPALPLVMHVINLFVVHLALFYFAIVAVVRVRTLRSERVWQLSFPIMAIAYVAVLTSLVEFGENMRFRLEVEPLIWVLSAAMIVGFWRYVRGDDKSGADDGQT